VESVRRDWSLLCRQIYNECMNLIFMQHNFDGAIQRVREYCMDMINGKLPLEHFVMSKEMKSHYANPEHQIHVQVAQKIARRKPGSEPQPGDRVPYVLVRLPNRSVKQIQQAKA